MEDLQVVQFLPDAATCSLCREMLHEPVTLTCGHNYCYTCILYNWNGSLRNVCCPQCNQIFDNVIPRPNKQLGNIVSIIKQAKEQCEMLERKWNQCEVHKEPAKLFCKDDYVPVCSSTCEKSREHRGHIVISVEEAVREYKRACYGRQYRKKNITLDPLKAHPRLKLSTDRKMAMYDCSSSYNSFPNPQGFDTSLCVLGAEGFSSGRHCWEVELTSEGKGWALGITKASVQRTSKVSIDFHQGIWALQSEDLPLFRHRPGTFRIRIYLDYERGCLQFFHAPARELIYTISYIAFTGEKIFPFFKLGSITSQLKLCF